MTSVPPAVMPPLIKDLVIDGLTREDFTLNARHYEHCRFSNIVLRGAQLRQIKFEKCVFERVSVITSEFRELNFINCTVNNLQVDQSVIADCYTDQSKITAVYADGLLLENLTLNKATVHKAEVKNSKLYTVIAAAAVLEAITVNDNEISQTSITQSTLAYLTYYRNRIKARLVTASKITAMVLAGGQAEDLVHFECELEQLQIKTIKVLRLSFHKSVLRGVVINEAVFTYGNYVGATVVNGRHEKVVWQNSQFTEAHIKDCIFNNCIFTIAFFNRARIDNASFSGSELQRCDYRGAEVISGNLWAMPQTDSKTDGIKVAAASKVHMTPNPLLAVIAGWYQQHRVGPRGEYLKQAVLPSGVSRYGI